MSLSRPTSNTSFAHFEKEAIRKVASLFFVGSTISIFPPLTPASFPDVMVTAPFIARRPGRFYRHEVCFIVSAFLAAYLPFWPIATWLQTYMHPWRPELIAAAFAVAGLVWALRSHRFRDFVAHLPRIEWWAIVLPIAAFAVWSFASVAWANSTSSVLHHSLTWVVFLTFYVVLRPHLTAETQRRTSALIASVFVLVLCVPPVITYYGFVVTGGTASIALGYSKWAEVVNALLPLVVVLALSPHRRVSNFALAIVALVWFFDIATLRRTAIVIFPVAVLTIGIIVYVFGQFKQYRSRVKYLVVMLAVVPLIAYSASFVGNVEDPATSRMNDWTVETSNNARLHLARIGFEMFLSRPVTGVGADNFGYEFRRYNESYAADHPDDRNLFAMEIGVPERAHNEFVQVIAELGVVGFAIILWFLIGFVYLVVSRLRQRGGLPIFTFGALIGIGAFLASSLVSSYSFRSTQNGIVFFFLLAVAVGGLTEGRRSELKERSASRRTAWLVKPALGFGIAACIGLIFLSTWRAVGVYYAYRATERASFNESITDFEHSLRIDPENAAAYSATGRLLVSHGKATEATSYFRKAIDLGRATPADYSYLATAHIMAGDAPGARSALAEAVRTYPFSIFLRTRYSVVLAELGETEEADRQFATAESQNESQARSWRNLVTVGADKAGRMAYQQQLPALMDLQPTPAVYAMVMERELRFPDERVAVP